MPILALGPNGQIYQTSPDRADGLGFGCAPETVDQQDVTLGSAYLKSQARRREELLKAHYQQKILDQRAAQAERLALKREALAKKKERMVASMYENPELVKAVTKKALQMGCDCEYKTAMSGNVMTANGQSGWRGMSRDQQTLHHAVTGMGRNVAYRPDPVEVQQRQAMKRAENALRMKARK